MKRFMVHGVEIYSGDRVSHSETGEMWEFVTAYEQDGHVVVEMVRDDLSSIANRAFRPYDFGGTVIEVSD